QIHGIILQARRFGTTSIVGAFVAPHGGVHSTHNCDGVNDTIITWYGKVTSNVTYTWLPSDDATGTIQFVAMVFTKDDVYWENVTSRRIRKGTVKHRSTNTLITTLELQQRRCGYVAATLRFTSIDVSKCGKEKGCFRYISGAKDCDANTCEYLLTYEREGNLANFELSAKADWVAGGDDVLMCVRTRRDAEVRHYFTNYNHVPPTLMSSNPLFNKQVEVTDDGRVSCRFSRPMKVDNDQFSVDLNNDWWQFYAWGPVSSGTCHVLPPLAEWSRCSGRNADSSVPLSYRAAVESRYRIVVLEDCGMGEGEGRLGDKGDGQRDGIECDTTVIVSLCTGGAIMRHSLEAPPASDFKITLSHRRNVISAASDRGAVLCIYPIVCVIHVMVGALHTGESYPT
ncbi:hypothetical protein NP493_822g00022, partial [Ridgeia piscesae]